MDTILEMILNNLVTNYPVGAAVVMGLGSLVILAQAYVVATPTKEDDAWWAKLEETPYLGRVLRVLTHFAVIQRKDPPPPPPQA